MAEQPKTPKPTPSSERLSEGQGSIGDIENVADDAAEGHPPPVKPQPPTVNVNVDKR